MAPLALLLLGDGRLPAGGYAHSGGVEEAVRDGRVHDEASLRAYTALRLATTGTTDAGLAAAVVHARGEAAALDLEAEARIPSAAQRATSRRLGRQLARTAARLWPAPVFATAPAAPHLGVALGLASLAAGLTPGEAALLAAYHAATTSTSAAVRLLGLDPVAAHRLVADLAPEIDAVVAAATAGHGPDTLPGPSAPLVELAAERHHARKERLFAS